MKGSELAVSPVIVPGFDSNAPYVSRLSARSALYTELRLLLDGHSHALRPQEYRSLVTDENCLGRSSAAARAKLWQELRSRYRLNSADPLYKAFWSEWRLCQSDPERGLTAYVLLALNDRLVADLGVEWFFPLLRRAPAEIRGDDVRSFLSTKARGRHPEVGAWSQETISALTKKYCASLRDFGLATGIVNKKSVRPALYGGPTRLLIRALRLTGVLPLRIVQDRAFRLLGIDSSEVVEALGELNRTGSLRFRMQGDVVELNLPEAA
jgi:hypothetical protein